jgi:hypothetical protein
MEGERITANLPPGECGSHNPLRVRELTPKPVSLMLVAKAVQGPTMARPKQLTSKHPRVLPSDKSACKLDEAVVEGVLHSAALEKRSLKAKKVQKLRRSQAKCWLPQRRVLELEKGTQTAGGILPYGPMTQRIQRPILGIDWLNPSTVSSSRTQEPGY